MFQLFSECVYAEEYLLVVVFPTFLHNLLVGTMPYK